jgi:hypothetical protein
MKVSETMEKLTMYAQLEMSLYTAFGSGAESKPDWWQESGLDFVGCS